MNLFRQIPIAFILLITAPVWGQDTLRISINQADSIFLAHNFELLASSMNIEAQKAGIVQAKLYPNPVFTAEFNAIDPENKKIFHAGNSGQKGFQFEQLILVGGKRKAEIELAKTNAGIAEQEFQNLLRQLKYELHTGMYALNQQRLLLDIYNTQLSLLDTILNAYDIQAKKGNVPLKDVVRLKGVYLNLNNNRAELLKMHFEEMAQVQIILQTGSIVVPSISEDNFSGLIKVTTLNDLQNTALQNRPDYLISLQNNIAAEQYYSYQKKLAVPDINLFSSYDQRGGAFQNQVNAGVSLPLPFWNRNQGNIRAARVQVKQIEYNGQGLKNKIFVELQNNYLLYNQTINEYKKATSLYNEDFEITLRGMSDNFKKQNVSIVEFVDFFEAYNDALSEIARIKIQLAISAEQLNLTIGKEFY